jgi:hypothetical protein
MLEEYNGENFVGHRAFFEMHWHILKAIEGTLDASYGALFNEEIEKKITGPSKKPLIAIAKVLIGQISLHANLLSCCEVAKEDVRKYEQKKQRLVDHPIWERLIKAYGEYEININSARWSLGYREDRRSHTSWNWSGDIEDLLGPCL